MGTKAALDLCSRSCPSPPCPTSDNTHLALPLTPQPAPSLSDQWAFQYQHASLLKHERFPSRDGVRFAFSRTPCRRRAAHRAADSHHVRNTHTCSVPPALPDPPRQHSPRHQAFACTWPCCCLPPTLSSTFRFTDSLRAIRVLSVSGCLPGRLHQS